MASHAACCAAIAPAEGAPDRWTQSVDRDYPGPSIRRGRLKREVQYTPVPPPGTAGTITTLWLKTFRLESAAVPLSASLRDPSAGDG